MSSQNVSEIYRLFHDAGISPLLIALFGIKAAIASVAIFLGANLVWVTVKRKSLHSNCNVLLALYAVCSCFQQANFFVPFFCALVGQPYIVYWRCFLLQMAPIFCSFAAFPLTFFIASERFTAICFPIWYKARNQRRFLWTTLAICAILGLYVFSLDAKTALDSPMTEVICTVGPKVDASFFTLLILAMNVASVCFYVIIWAVVKSNNKFSSVQKSVIRCLFVLLLLELFGWALSISFRLLLTPVFGILSSSFTGFLIVNLVTNLAYIAMALTTPMLYAFSKEHRDAFQEQFSQCKALLWCRAGDNSVPTSSNSSAVLVARRSDWHGTSSVGSSSAYKPVHVGPNGIPQQANQMFVRVSQ